MNKLKFDFHSLVCFNACIESIILQVAMNNTIAFTENSLSLWADQRLVIY